MINGSPGLTLNGIQAFINCTSLPPTERMLTFGFFLFLFLFLFSTRPPPGLLPVLGPLGSGTDATHQPSPALRLLGYSN